MTREELISYCKYYKGEEESPYKEQNKDMLWFYENVWVREVETNSFDVFLIDEYLTAGLEKFQMFDNIPISFKALLFNRYAKISYSLADAKKGFEKFYMEYYA